MTRNKFEMVKEDLKREYASILCPESLEYIDRAETPAELASVLHTYMVVIACKPIPTDEWMRKWFEYDKSELNEFGFYLDQTEELTDPMPEIVCFGRCSLNLHFTKPKVWNILAYGSSSIAINTHTICQVNVRQKDNSMVIVPVKHHGSIVKIRKV